MAYPYGSPHGGQGQYPTQPSAAYGGYWPQFTPTANEQTSPVTQLVWAVLVLGLATYLVSYAIAPQAGGIGWGVRFSTLAAVVAALGLLPRQSAHTKLVLALAVMGFLEALPQLNIGGGSPSGARIAIVVINALQALTAIVTLLARRKIPGAAAGGFGTYDAYAYYAQAAQQYYAANNQQQQPAQAHGMAEAKAAAPAPAQQSVAERDALYTEYLNTQRPGPNPTALSAQSGGRTQTAPPAAGTSRPASGPTESIRPRTDPATGPPTQSS